MQYRHAPATNFADLDAVLASAPGRPSLPVRLTLELFGRCREHLGDPGPAVIWDPCCGTGQLLTTLGLLRREEVAALVGSDADPEPLALATRNLALLGPGGASARAAELDGLAEQYGKPSYSDAAAAARRLGTSSAHGPPSEITVADALDPAATGAIVARHRPMIVLADLPYGRQTSWTGRAVPEAGGPADDLEPRGGPDPTAGSPPSGGDAPDADGPGPEAGFVAALARVLDPAAVIAVVAQTRKVALPPGTAALERLRVGHRAAAIVRAGGLV